MLTEAVLSRLRARMEEDLKALETEGSNAREDRQTVALDQQSVGRLSRMDALQRQAMAQATDRRRHMRRARLVAAINRLDEGEFGYCQDCGEDIAEARLSLDPTVTTCISCLK